MTQNAIREVGKEPQGKERDGSTSLTPLRRSTQDARPARLFARGPFSLMRQMSDEMDRLFDDFFAGALPAEWGDWGRRAGWPDLEVVRGDDELVVRADLPGVRSEDVTLEVDQNALVLRGERRHEHESHDGDLQRSERIYGSFQRSIPLPEGARIDEAKAEFRDGVLEIRVPVPQTLRRIPITSEARR